MINHKRIKQNITCTEILIFIDILLHKINQIWFCCWFVFSTIGNPHFRGFTNKKILCSLQIYFFLLLASCIFSLAFFLQHSLERHTCISMTINNSKFGVVVRLNVALFYSKLMSSMNDFFGFSDNGKTHKQ